LNNKFRLTFKPYILELKHPFGISYYTRKDTPIVLTEIAYNGEVGYGEASMPQYLGETQESVIKFLSKVDLRNYNDPKDIDNILNYVDLIEEGNNAAKASVDIALHDLVGKILGIPVYKYFGLNKPTDAFTSYTIGIDSTVTIRNKLDEASEFKYYKIKLGAKNDKEIIETVRKYTDSDLFVDVNQGWKDKIYALDMIEWLAEYNVILVEQPLPKAQIDDLAWLNENSPLPILADEAVLRLNDIFQVKDIYSGINIKLMKSTGLREATAMIKKARDLDMKIMLGCMTETSCAVTAAAHLCSLADWLDLDGPLLVKNDIFKGISYSEGSLHLNDLPGIGIVRKKNLS
jgi:L-Ala-D/L-Glu epimerase / N-acetyl-D-glutamate racemase